MASGLTEKNLEKRAYSARQAEAGLHWGVGEMQGWRRSMEDAYVAMGSLSAATGKSEWADAGLFCVFDGHGGAQVAKFVAEQLPKVIVRGRADRAPAALSESFFTVDRMLVEVGKNMSSKDPAHPDKVGCTAVACLVRKDFLYVANAGDSRAVLSRGGRACELSTDHKPDSDREMARIRKAGGFVRAQHVPGRTVHRVNGRLAVSRAMGDLHYKQNPDISQAEQIVSCSPEINICKRQPHDEFLVVACDGIWDVLSSQEVVDIVRSDLPAIRRGELKPDNVVCKILDRCLAPKQSATGIGEDNMTMILVVFDSTNVPLNRQQDGQRSTGMLPECMRAVAQPGQPDVRAARDACGERTGPTLLGNRAPDAKLLKGAAAGQGGAGNGSKPAQHACGNQDSSDGGQTGWLQNKLAKMLQGFGSTMHR